MKPTGATPDDIEQTEPDRPGPRRSHNRMEEYAMMNHMTQPHPDNLRLIALITDHDQATGNAPDPAGKVAGYDSFALLGAAGHRAQLMLEGHGTLRKTGP
ncbi:hypothetical protein SNOUR_43695 [Streptomyces noursei ATCC 11455]|nr:hypothetical protein SNOUR_00255 [Streptomyces noursei ATCC 11455]ANZ21961.1 hypothetical protein SNOUR_43695 [Streptomyces noursei ATCC 11455]